MILNFVKDSFRKYAFYRELRYAYRAHTIYRKLPAYLYHRFWVRRQIKRRRKPLDRRPTRDDYSIHLLCSHRDLDQMLWALSSWHRVVSKSGQVYVHEDGTFTSLDRKLVRSLLPYANFIDYKEASEQATREWLATASAARKYRADRSCIWAIKLMDPYFVTQTEYILVLDTDILWFKEPLELLGYIDAREHPVFWTASGKLWTFPLQGGESIESNVNSGIVFYKRDTFKLEMVEEFCRKIGPDMGPPLLDQPGYAYILDGDGNARGLSTEYYHVKGPTRAATVAKHYTGPRREQIWFEGIKLLSENFLDR